MKKILALTLFLLLLSGNIFSESSVNVGGHMALSMFDLAAGTSTYMKDKDSSAVDYAGFKFLRFMLFIKASLSEKVLVDIQPIFETRTDGTTGATQKFPGTYKDSAMSVIIGKQRGLSPKVDFQGFNRATAKMVLGGGTELSFGYVHPRFTWDYGNELFWEDELNANPFSLDLYLGNLDAVGFEVVHYFELADGNFTIPFYGYVLNGAGEPGGGSVIENNNSPFGMVHIEPEIGSLKLHLSVGGGVWDEKNSKLAARAAVGLSFSDGPFSARAEGAVGYWDSLLYDSKDAAMPFGGYAKCFYKVSKNLRLSLAGSFDYHNFIMPFQPHAGKEQWIAVSPGLQLTTSPGSRVVFQLDLAQGIYEPYKNNGVETYERYDRTISYVHPTIGWRLTF
ncbi:MAG: hypothetical protein JNL74_06325 [Fibrobacteres bacterium]|nr:hypothetical protein [Fibrobacterota bacterium]